jgi:eukaryotic-like serine/threonine-protein kinase
MSPDDLIGRKYRLLRPIGRGAMGEVWAAVNIDTDREVALKLITHPDPDLLRRLKREARAIGRLEHPNIVQILDRGETTAGLPFLVMQLLLGDTLRTRLLREGRLAQPVAVGIALDIARALRIAHEKHVIHRDLKPANIILHQEPDNEDEVVKVVDFGVSKLTVDADGGGTLAGNLVGSPAYMSPEQIRGGEVDGRTDLWALGVMLFEMLAGVRPFTGDQPVEVLTKIVRQPIPRIESLVPDVDPALGNVVAGCLERSLAARVESAGELVRLLRPFVTRGRFATVEETRARFLSIAEEPAPESVAAAPESAAAAPAAPDGEREVVTTVFKPSELLGAIAALPPPQSSSTGTTLAGLSPIEGLPPHEAPDPEAAIATAVKSAAPAVAPAASPAPVSSTPVSSPPVAFPSPASAPTDPSPARRPMVFTVTEKLDRAVVIAEMSADDAMEHDLTLPLSARRPEPSAVTSSTTPYARPFTPSAPAIGQAPTPLGRGPILVAVMAAAALLAATSVALFLSLRHGPREPVPAAGAEEAARASAPDAPAGAASSPPPAATASASAPAPSASTPPLRPLRRKEP